MKKIEIIERITDANGSISENILTSERVRRDCSSNESRSCGNLCESVV